MDLPGIVVTGASGRMGQMLVKMIAASDKARLVGCVERAGHAWLGRDMGDLVPRKDLETPARFLGYHLLRCADAALASLAKAITERDPALPPTAERS